MTEKYPRTSKDTEDIPGITAAKEEEEKEYDNRIRGTPSHGAAVTVVGRAKTSGAREHPHRRTNSCLGGVAVCVGMCPRMRRNGSGLIAGEGWRRERFAERLQCAYCRVPRDNYPSHTA